MNQIDDVDETRRLIWEMEAMFGSFLAKAINNQPKNKEELLYSLPPVESIVENMNLDNAGYRSSGIPQPKIRKTNNYG